MATRLDLWNKGHLAVLAAREKANNRPPTGRSKTQRVSRRVAHLLSKTQCARATTLAGSLGVVEATHDTVNAIGPLFLDPGRVDPQDLLDYYGPHAPPLLENQPSSIISLELLRTCLAAAPPLSSLHRDGWRNEHLVDFARDPAFGSALARMLTAVVDGDVP